MTSARRVAVPLSSEDALAQILDWRQALPVRHATARCLEEWVGLTRDLKPAAQAVHDMNLVAHMRGHGISEICTANVGDSEGIPGITVRRPEELLTALSERRGRRIGTDTQSHC